MGCYPMTPSPIFIALLPLESIDIREQANRPSSHLHIMVYVHGLRSWPVSPLLLLHPTSVI